jgi:protein-tyrosine phosphatase
LAKVIDLHSHILPGIDDGARTLGDSIEMALAAVDGGISTVAATPHVRNDYPTAAETMERLLGVLREALAWLSIDLRVLGGAEVAIPSLRAMGRDDLRRFALAGNPRYLLVEFPYVGWPIGLEADIEQLRSLGITPVLAHPERNPDVQLAPKQIELAVSAGALVQLTAASVDGRLGSRTRRTAFELIQNGLAHLIASDAHLPSVRSIGLQDAFQALNQSDLAQWLVEDVPRAIVEDTPIPPRPRDARRLRLFRR